MTGRRIVSIWLPQFPMERRMRQAARLAEPLPQDLAFALVADGAQGPVIHAANRAAALAGVQPGARLTDMRALCPALRAEPADPQGDRAALGRLALWARRWCPWTAPDDRSTAEGAAGFGLVLDTTGSDHLWGGEAAMLETIEGALAVAGHAARLAVAPGWGAAWALARLGPRRAICHDVAADLAGLPVAGLRLDAATLLLLDRLGLRRIGQLAALPRAALARRFARSAPPEANPLLRLDQIAGLLPEPVSPPAPPPAFCAEARLAEPVLDPLPHLAGLAEALCAQLAAAGHGARALRLTAYRSDGDISRIEAGTALPQRDAAHLAALLRDRLDRLDPGFGFDLLTLEATEAEPLAPAQPGLGGGHDPGLDLAQLIDRLGARFGRGALRRLDPVASHIPERAEARAHPTAHPTAHPSAAAPGPEAPQADRPARLLHPAEEVQVLYAVPEGPPAQFLWRRRSHRVTRYQGPERIAPEWWQDRPGTRLRDYFRVEDEAGLRLWLYREGLHGDGRGGAPRWFVQGIFA